MVQRLPNGPGKGTALDRAIGRPLGFLQKKRPIVVSLLLVIVVRPGTPNSVLVPFVAMPEMLRSYRPMLDYGHWSLRRLQNGVSNRLLRRWQWIHGVGLDYTK